MYEVTLKQLKCIETEDWGDDECALDIEVDGRQKPYLRQSMGDGETWSVNRKYSFENTVEIRLLDEDSPDADDVLGRVNIEPAQTSGSKAMFTGSGAEYQLLYAVSEVPSTDRVAEAISDFRRSSKRGVWRYINKQDILVDIERTISNPYCVNQRSTPLCGPAAIVFELVRKDPAKYVNICQSLFEQGSFRSRSHNISASNSLRNSRPHSTTSSADWILMATMRDEENELFDVQGNSNSFVMGITTPWEMAGWTEEVLGYDTVDYESTNFYGEFDALRSAKKAASRRGVGFVMIHSDMLRGQRPSFDFPNHWVSYLGGLDIDEGEDPWWFDVDNGHVKFDCYSWGRKMNVSVGEGAFEDAMWGVVTGY